MIALTIVTILNFFGMVGVLMQRPVMVDNYARLQLGMTFILIIFVLVLTGQVLKFGGVEWLGIRTYY
jgi:hypothetical protein